MKRIIVMKTIAKINSEEMKERKERNGDSNFKALSGGARAWARGLARQQQAQEGLQRARDELASTPARPTSTNVDAGPPVSAAHTLARSDGGYAPHHHPSIPSHPSHSLPAAFGQLAGQRSGLCMEKQCGSGWSARLTCQGLPRSETASPASSKRWIRADSRSSFFLLTFFLAFVTPFAFFRLPLRSRT